MTGVEPALRPYLPRLELSNIHNNNPAHPKIC
jgi:hypothetical protein